MTINIVSYKDVHQTVSFGTAASTSGTVQSIDVNATTASANELVASCLGAADGEGTMPAFNVTVGSDRGEATDLAFFSVSSSDQTGLTGTVNTEWTWDSTFLEVALFVIPIKELTVTPASRRQVRTLVIQ